MSLLSPQLEYLLLSWGSLSLFHDYGDNKALYFSTSSQRISFDSGGFRSTRLCCIRGRDWPHRNAGADPAVIEMGKSERKQGLRFTSYSLCDWSRTMYLIVI